MRSPPECFSGDAGRMSPLCSQQQLSYTRHCPCSMTIHVTVGLLFGMASQIIPKSFVSIKTKLKRWWVCIVGCALLLTIFLMGRYFHFDGHQFEPGFPFMVRTCPITGGHHHRPASGVTPGTPCLFSTCFPCQEL